jgi:hypothetical protein
MLLAVVGIDVPTDASLIVVAVVLGAGVAASYLLPSPPEPDGSDY